MRHAASLGTAQEASSVFGHPRRRAAFEHVQLAPGPTLAEVAEACGMTNGPAYHHLRILERAGLVSRRQVGRCIRFFESGSLAAANWQETSARRDRGLAILLDTIEEEPGLAQHDLFALMSLANWPRSTTQHRLRRLELAGLVSVSRRGRRHHYYRVGSTPALNEGRMDMAHQQTVAVS